MLHSWQIWSTCVSVISGNLIRPTSSRKKFCLIAERLCWKREHVFAYADPFLLSAEGRLWLFVEQQTRSGKGCIAAFSTIDLLKWERHGVVLRESTHLSYPQVFREGGMFWMVPESAQSGAVWLYQAKTLPGPWVRSKKLLEGVYVDPTLICHETRWYIWLTDSLGALRFYHSDQLQGPFKEHVSSPITTDNRYARCGGRPVRLPDGSLIRLAQDGSGHYGNKLHGMRIEVLTSSLYQETLMISDVLPRDAEWNAMGGHHMDCTVYNEETVQCVDGWNVDRNLNSIPRAFWRLIDSIKRVKTSLSLK